MVLAGLQAGLAQRGDFEIVSVQSSLRDTVGESLTQAQVAVVDLAGDADMQLMAEIADHGPALVVLSPDHDGPIGDWLLAGFTLLPRDASIELIAIAAQAAAAGLVASTPALIAGALRVGAAPEPHRVVGATEPLTPREREVLSKMTLGLGNREIAQALHISAHTAKFHVGQIIAKLDALSRAHAVAKALRSGLVEI